MAFMPALRLAGVLAGLSLLREPRPTVRSLPPPPPVMVYILPPHGTYRGTKKKKKKKKKKKQLRKVNPRYKSAAFGMSTAAALGMPAGDNHTSSTVLCSQKLNQSEEDSDEEESDESDDESEEESDDESEEESSDEEEEDDESDDEEQTVHHPAGRVYY
jgi:hypothetical protein